MTIAAGISYILCALISSACAALLLRSWWRSRASLVFWTAIAFLFLVIANVLLLFDVFGNHDLALMRPLVIAIGLGFLIFGLVWGERQR